MSKFKVYHDKNQRTFVAVDTAEIRTFYKCPWTKKVYKSKKQYLCHLKNYRENTIANIVVSKMQMRAKHRLQAAVSLNHFVEIFNNDTFIQQSTHLKIKYIWLQPSNYINRYMCDFSGEIIFSTDRTKKDVKTWEFMYNIGLFIYSFPVDETEKNKFTLKLKSTEWSFVNKELTLAILINNNFIESNMYES